MVNNVMKKKLGTGKGFKIFSVITVAIELMKKCSVVFTKITIRNQTITKLWMTSMMSETEKVTENVNRNLKEGMS